jgi:hypothetical protein
MVKRLFFLLALMTGYLLNAQESDCKVLLPRIGDKYRGECKKGLAHGKGVAQGIDRYEGEFKKGFPEGLGVYHWADGSYYEGYFRQGLREGTGTMTFRPDSTLRGFWKTDKYTGKAETKQYDVIQSRYVARTSFIKSSNSPLQVKVKFTLGGAPNTTIEDFSMTYSSGEEFRMGLVYGIQNVTFPVNVRITYLTWNAMHTVQTNATLEFNINDPGTWDVNVQN